LILKNIHIKECIY